MIRLYSDQECKFVLEALDLGRVELGKTNKYRVYMKNTDPQWKIDNIKVESVNAELSFDYPNTLSPNQIQEVFISWTPKLNARKPLSSQFKFTGEVLIG